MKPTINNCLELRKNVCAFSSTYEHHKQGFTAIGWGDCFHVNFNIPREELYCEDGGRLTNNKIGNLPHKMYYVTNEFYRKNIMNGPTMSEPTTMSEQVKLAEQYLGKPIMGTIKKNAFTPDCIRIVNTHGVNGSSNNFLLPKDVDIVKLKGWIVILESFSDYVNILNVEEVKSFKLNDDYTATIEGDKVKVGCQSFDKELILKLAEFLKVQ